MACKLPRPRRGESVPHARVPTRQRAREPNLVPEDVCKASPPLDKPRKPVKSTASPVACTVVREPKPVPSEGRQVAKLARKCRESGRVLRLLQSEVRLGCGVIREGVCEGDLDSPGLRGP